MSYKTSFSPVGKGTRGNDQGTAGRIGEEGKRAKNEGEIKKNKGIRQYSVLLIEMKPNIPRGRHQEKKSTSGTMTTTKHMYAGQPTVYALQQHYHWTNARRGEIGPVACLGRHQQQKENEEKGAAARGFRIFRHFSPTYPERVSPFSAPNLGTYVDAGDARWDVDCSP
jgi:hypothetical protein